MLIKETHEEILPCHLTEPELRERGDEVARLLHHRDLVTAQAKSAAQGFKAQIAELEDKIAEIGNEIRTRQTERAVTCEVQLHYDVNRALTVRVDTGEVIRQRGLEQDEIQTSLFEPPSPTERKRRRRTEETEESAQPIE